MLSPAELYLFRHFICRTSSRSENVDSTFTFAFTGVGISIWGTVPSTPANGTQAVVVFTIDDTTTSTFTAPTTQTTLFGFQYYFQSLDDGEHMIKAQALSGEMILDYLQYTPVPSGSSSSVSEYSSEESEPPSSLSPFSSIAHTYSAVTISTTQTILSSSIVSQSAVPSFTSSNMSTVDG